MCNFIHYKKRKKSSPRKPNIKTLRSLLQSSNIGKIHKKWFFLTKSSNTKHFGITFSGYVQNFVTNTKCSF